jgi:L-rhamnonate dehydratase
MKITGLRALKLNRPPHTPATPPSRRSWWQDAEVANPVSVFPRFKPHRNLWLPAFEETWVEVTLEDGTTGLGMTHHGRVTAALINDYFAPRLLGEDGLALEQLSDLLLRLSVPFTASGLASYAVSAIDLALWDAKGKVYGKPVYELLGGGGRPPLQCYATGNDVDWYLELGFRAFKLACPYGPADGLTGLRHNEAFVAHAREVIGDDCDLMLDCWMAFDVEYAVQLAERLRPYRLTWIEECLLPEDLDAHTALRERLPWQTLATGEHWTTTYPFQWAASHRVVDILQPDISWCGGLSACWKIAGLAAAAGTRVILHGGANTVFGHHYSYASRAAHLAEFFVGTQPGVPLAEAGHLPGQALPKDGYLLPNDAPGFGLAIPADWFTPFA